ncbi:probable disease resistance protein At1g15890 [Typha latifolia]|uniref:probable disease resistance protein At1g15890 n=1 Tax=Typha latifolia TaxID=4733 RepID=UPI003C2CB199
MVRHYLSGEDNEIVGIWGMGGVRKTTLLKLINNSLLGEGNLGFDLVIWKDASLNGNRISGFLRDKHFLLLVDGLFKEIDLNRVGIPISNRSNVAAATYKHKLVFTTRFESEAI